MENSVKKLEEQIAFLQQEISQMSNELYSQQKEIKELKKEIDLYSVENLKRVRSYDIDWKNSDAQGLHFITDFQEVKTTWHPIENIGGASSTY